MNNIKRLNQKIGKEVLGHLNEQKAELEDVFVKYEELAKKGALTKIRFDSCDADGTFTKYDGGLLIVLPGSNVVTPKMDINKYSVSRMIGVELPLNVKEVDRENKKVYCAMPAAMAADTIRSAVSREIYRALNKGKYPLVWGKVKKITANRIHVDILNQGILGFIDASHWQKCYTRQLTGMCEVGDFLQFEVIKQAPKKKGVPTAWILSRRSITEDAWSLIDYESLKVDSAIVVKCVERPRGKSYWWGRSDRVPGIEIMGDFTFRFQSGKTLLEGIRYVCKIEEIFISKENHKMNKFKVVPFEVFPDDAGKVSGYRELMKKRYYGK